MPRIRLLVSRGPSAKVFIAADASAGAGCCGVFIAVGLVGMESKELEAGDHAGEGAPAGAGYDDHVEGGVEVGFLRGEFEGEAGEAEAAADGFQGGLGVLAWRCESGMVWIIE